MKREQVMDTTDTIVRLHLSVAEAIHEMKAGRLLLICDDETRENEADMCMAAQFATPQAINFMAILYKGLPLRLQLMLFMAQQQASPHMIVLRQSALSLIQQHNPNISCGQDISIPYALYQEAYYNDEGTPKQQWTSCVSLALNRVL